MQYPDHYRTSYGAALFILCAVMFMGASCQMTTTTESVVNIDTNTVQAQQLVHTDATLTNTDEEMQDAAPQLLSGQYIEYSADRFTAAAESGKVVLFFHAPWCPTCAALDRDINAHLDAIPAGVTILKTDYETYTELKKKYGVTYQHTLVQVDASGTQLHKWSGGNILTSVVAQLR
ncbi:MAG: thioredoxin family protein [Candidatus Kerfeldbacteria bacterium]|nr:thioredoxin family protein [Candidatus Kerfeldbacteria bacterium]